MGDEFWMTMVTEKGRITYASPVCKDGSYYYQIPEGKEEEFRNKVVDLISTFVPYLEDADKPKFEEKIKEILSSESLKVAIRYSCYNGGKLDMLYWVGGEKREHKLSVSSIRALNSNLLREIEDKLNDLGERVKKLCDQQIQQKEKERPKIKIY